MLQLLDYFLLQFSNGNLKISGNMVNLCSALIGYHMQLNIAKLSCNFRSLYVTINVKCESLVLLVGFLPVQVCILVQQINGKRNKGIKCPTCFSEVSGWKVFLKLGNLYFLNIRCYFVLLWSSLKKFLFGFSFNQ